ncbi:hypothetical protein CVT25_005842 [Psilocybe cyanescens]|uniref:DUF300-domain-containing protein n=1 Tax=Psilocybe cyanescens TaxID=93625 RepID=A0A409VLZ2_PSICY|nr:hypothetical protein CVT25_005842 [Psilocybe cyanescens]
MSTCPSDNTADIDQSSFWSSGTLHWDAHRIGWAVAGACTVATLIISIFTVLSHCRGVLRMLYDPSSLTTPCLCRNYTNSRHQLSRNRIRILYMPPIYAVISFLSYRFFRDYTYYSFVEVEFVADKSAVQNNAMVDKDKKSLMFPPYFMHAIKWSVLQYVIVRPAVSVIGMICQAKGILCESEGFNTHFANVYLEAIDFASISIALYGLLLFYALTKEDLVGKKPLAKFLCIKLIVMFTWYQSFVFSALQNRVIHGTEFWTSTNVANGLNALTICIEMICFSVFMWWAYPYQEYKRPAGTPATSIWRPLWDSFKPSVMQGGLGLIPHAADFAKEIITSLMYFIQPHKYHSYSKSGPDRPKKASFDSAFLLNGHGNRGSTRKQRPPTSAHTSEDIPLANQPTTTPV